MSLPSKRLRSEIQEYSSLLRALRTASTSNLATHLYPHDVAIPTDASETVQSQTALVTGNDGQQQAPIKQRGLQTWETGNWTRWPLMSDDVYPPTWTLEEEVASLAERCISLDDETTTLEKLSPENRNALTSAALHAIARSFSTLPPIFPLVDKGSQGRIRAMDWQMLLQVIESSRIFPSEVVKIVRQRMADLHGVCPSSSSGVEQRIDDDYDQEHRRKLRTLQVDFDYLLEDLPP